MSSRPDPVEALRGQRPPDPTAEDGAAAADRVLARVSMRIRSSRRRRGWWRWGIAAAAMLVVGFGVATRVDDERTPDRDPATPTPPAASSALAPLVAPAVAGDAVARNRLRGGGRAARAVLLDAAEDSAFVDRAGALALVRVTGSLRDGREIARVVRLTRDPTVREAAVGLLARTVGSRGVAALGSVLESDAGAEADVVAALRRVARGGRREAALQALLRGVESGRVEALAAALHVASALQISRVLDVMPRRGPANAQVVAAVRTVSDATRRRLLRLAGHGDGNALRLIGEARLPEAVRVLAVVANQPRLGRARAAVDWLAAQDTVVADVALARSLDGFVGDEAQAALSARPPERQRALADHARRSRRDRIAALRALGTSPAGVAHVERLARVPRLVDAAVQALSTARTSDASLALARLGADRARFDEALHALLVRLELALPGAQEGLLALARAADARAVLRAALRAEGGDAVLEAAQQDPALRDAAAAVQPDRARERVGPRRRVPGVARSATRRRSST